MSKEQREAQAVKRGLRSRPMPQKFSAALMFELWGKVSEAVQSPKGSAVRRASAHGVQ